MQIKNLNIEKIDFSKNKYWVNKQVRKMSFSTNKKALIDIIIHGKSSRKYDTEIKGLSKGKVHNFILPLLYNGHKNKIDIICNSQLIKTIEIDMEKIDYSYTNFAIENIDKKVKFNQTIFLFNHLDGFRLIAMDAEKEIRAMFEPTNIIDRFTYGICYNNKDHSIAFISSTKNEETFKYYHQSLFKIDWSGKAINKYTCDPAVVQGLHHTVNFHESKSKKYSKCDGYYVPGNRPEYIPGEGVSFIKGADVNYSPEDWVIHFDEELKIKDIVDMRKILFGDILDKNNKFNKELFNKYLLSFKNRGQDLMHLNQTQVRDNYLFMSSRNLSAIFIINLKNHKLVKIFRRQYFTGILSDLNKYVHVTPFNFMTQHDIVIYNWKNINNFEFSIFDNGWAGREWDVVENGEHLKIDPEFGDLHSHSIKTKIVNGKFTEYTLHSYPLAQVKGSYRISNGNHFVNTMCSINYHDGKNRLYVNDQELIRWEDGSIYIVVPILEQERINNE